MSTPAVVAFILGRDEAARARTIASLAAQTISVKVLGAGATLLTQHAPVLVMVAAGVALDTTACERAVWYLSSHPVAGWVSGGPYHDANPTAPLEACLQFCAVRSAEARAVMTDRVWRDAGHTGAATPGLAMHCIVSLKRRGAYGGWLDPVLAVAADDAAQQQTIDRAYASLPLLDLDETDFVEPELSAPWPLPLQHLIQPATPALDVQVAPATGARVLALLQGFPMGGYTAFNADVLPRLAARGHVITTACLEWWRSDWRLDQLRAVAPDIHHVPSVVPFAAMAAYVEHLMTSRAIDVVLLSHAFAGYRLLPWLRARFPHVAFVDYVHTEWFEQSMYGSYATMSAQWSAALDAHIASSRALAEAIVQGGAEPSRVQVAHIGIDTATWSRAGIDRDGIRSAFGASAESTVLLFAGRVSPEKRPLIAVEALEQLRAEGRDVRLVVAGDGPLLRAMHDMVATRGLAEWVSFLGEVDEATLRQVYSAADVFFAPSEIEGIARTLYEAMSMECVPVVSNVGGQRELVTTSCGTLVNPQPGTVATYLPSLRSWCDAAARMRAGQAARAHIVEHFDSQHTVAALEAAFSSARASARGRVGGEAPPALLMPPALAEEMAVLGLDVARRQALAAAAAANGARGRSA